MGRPGDDAPGGRAQGTPKRSVTTASMRPPGLPGIQRRVASEASHAYRFGHVETDSNRPSGWHLYGEMTTFGRVAEERCSSSSVQAASSASRSESGDRLRIPTRMTHRKGVWRHSREPDARADRWWPAGPPLDAPVSECTWRTWSVRRGRDRRRGRRRGLHRYGSRWPRPPRSTGCPPGAPYASAPRSTRPRLPPRVHAHPGRTLGSPCP